jgi:hypothetical protein
METMKKYFTVILLFMFMVLTGFSQEHYSLFFSSGYDNNLNHLSGMKYSNSNEFPDYNFGLGGAVYLNDRFRLRAELKFVNVSFTRKYNFQTTTDGTIDKSVLSISNFDFNPYIDYRVFSVGKFDFYGYTGFRFEFNVGSSQYVYTLDGDKSTKNIVETDYKKAMVGLTGGCSLSYNINKKLAVSISPEYTQFLHYFYSNNTANFNRSSVNLGVEWKF